MADFDEVADELYGLPVDEFVATRTRYERESREAGDRESADRIRALTKPNQAAWLANQVARQHGDQLQPLLDLGAELREATRTLAGDQLRALSRRQHELVTGLVQLARGLGRAQGHKVSEDTARAVADTLHAALVDEQAAQLLLAARLSTPLHRSGFGDGGAPPAAGTAARVSRPPAASRRKVSRPNDTEDKGSNDTGGDRRARARKAVDAAVRTRDEARAAADQAAQGADDARAKVDELRSALEQARATAAEADKHRREKDGALRRAERALEQAQRRQN